MVLRRYVKALGLHSASRLQRDLNEVRDAVANQGFSVLKCEGQRDQIRNILILRQDGQGNDRHLPWRQSLTPNPRAQTNWTGSAKT